MPRSAPRHQPVRHVAPVHQAPVLESESTWRSGKSSTQRGYGYRWQQYRKQFLRTHPLCCRCEDEGRVVVANVVDHIRPHRGDQALFWDPANHQALCKPHHDRAKQREERAATRTGSYGDNVRGAGQKYGRRPA